MKKRFLPFSITLLLSFVVILYSCAFFSVPSQLMLIKDNKYIYEVRSPVPLELSVHASGHQSIITLDSQSHMLTANTKGHTYISASIFGFLPLRKVSVEVIQGHLLAACGNTIGVIIMTKGILVIASALVEDLNGGILYPARIAGIEPGDVISEVDGKKLENIDQLVQIIDHSNGKTLKLTISRNEENMLINIKPVKSRVDDNYHIGLWVRDNTAGIGTLTFFDPDTKVFGALGHGITDIDTGTILPLNKGEILNADIVNVRKGIKGFPGELKGVFREDSGNLGKIFLNNNYGIFGELYEGFENKLLYKVYPIGVSSNVKTGNATIIANINGNETNEYQIEIIRIDRSDIYSSKSLVIRIIDQKLLEITGGIVQGMSGCPIIQNSRLIGAVTHVLVNDPSRGYGIMIESMLNNLDFSPNLLGNKNVIFPLLVLSH